ncbi:OmpL47-type beta-barrel domain-containing protein [Paenibacillus sp. UNC451MF]|uniref:OmpL47-type beta-barrel domain-containing protein n=1 Tax=Paenibacillus sp. UNC451MF TaxID=1449063 RepID=UPI000B034EA1|nr:Ig-like domain-containing protein [Paenibacillus sp. UNC451MF]
MIQKMLRGLFLLAVFVVCWLAGWDRMAHAAVMIEQLPTSANLPEVLPGASASTLSGQEILLTGGEDASKFKYPQHSYVFNTVSQTWSSYAPPLNLAFHIQSKLQDGKVLVTGGNNFTSGVGYTYNNLARIYNTGSNTWTNAASLPHDSLGHTQSTLLDGRVLVVGGANEIYSPGSSTLYNNAYIYSPTANRWDEAAPSPIGLYGAAQSTLKDGRVLVTGGLSGYVYSFNTYIYDPSNNTWTKMASLPFSDRDIFFRHNQVTLPNGKVLVMGNYNFYLYDPDTNTWTQDKPNPNYLINSSLMLIGNDVYIMGGYNDLDYTNNSAVYKLTFDFTPPTAPVISGAQADWKASDVNLTIAQGTDAESGVTRTEYSLSGATVQEWTPYTNGSTITITNSGQTTISARTVDNAGNTSTLATAVVKIDRSPPTAPVINRSSASWTNANVTFTLAGATDTGGSGVNRLEFSLSGATTLDWTTYTGTVTIATEGQTTVKSRTVDNVGNISTESTADIYMDKTLPTAPTVAPATTAWSKSDVSVTVTPGTDDASGVSRTEYKLSGVTTSGWTTYSGAITINAEGQTTIDARTIDIAGNISIIGTAVVKLDKTLPTTPTVSPATTAWSKGANVQATITGGADNASGVNRTEYSLSGATILGWTTYTVPVVINKEGQTTVTARTVDNAGNVSSTASTVVKIDRTEPTAPTVTPSVTTWTSANVNVALTAGTDTGGSGVTRTEYSLSGATNLSWSTYTGAFVVSAEGQTTITARTIDNAGNTSAVASGNVFIDKTAPTAPAIAATAGWTSVSSIPVAITAGADASGSGVQRVEYSLSGATTAGWTIYTAELSISAEGQTTISARTVDKANNMSTVQTVVISIDRTAPTAPVVTPETIGWTSAAAVPVTITAGTDSGGSGVNRTEYSLSGASTLNWTTYSSVLSITAEGQTTISARSIDKAGNVGAVSTALVQIDRTAPPTPVVISPEQGTVTNNNKPVIQGTAEAGAVIKLSIDDNAKLPVTADASGQWSYTVSSVLADSVYRITVVAMDAAGNISKSAANLVMTIDTAAPAAPVILTPEQGAVLGNAKPIIDGTAEARSTVRLYADTLSVGTIMADVDGEWTYALPSSLADGFHRMTATATDEAGNISAVSTSVTWTVDTQAPLAPVVLTPANGIIHGDNKPVISGTAEAGAEVEISLDGSHAGIGMADGTGKWMYTPIGALTDGAHTIQAVAKDAAGNVSPASIEVVWTIDTQAPPAPVIEAPLEGAILNTGLPAVRGRAEANASIRITWDGGADSSATADGSGNWGFTPSTVLSEGVHSVKTQATDAAGNVSPASTEVFFTVDTVSPQVPVVLQPTDGSITNQMKPVISGTSEASVTVSVYVDGAIAADVKADSSGGWSYIPVVGLTVGEHSVQAQATDAASNESAVSTEHRFTVVSDNAGLRTLELSGITLNETVTGTTYRYTAQVPYDMASTAITAVPTDANASVQILQDGQSVANPIILQVGIQTFTIQVTAQDGITVQPYTVTVSRGYSSEVSLSDLSVSPAILTPNFSEGVTDYTATVTNDVYSVMVRAKASSAEASIQINGTSFMENNGIISLELKVGSNPVVVIVTAQDGITTQSYRVDVNRKPSSNVILNGLELSVGDLTPVFNSGIVHYEKTVEHGTTSATVTASVYDRTATLTVNGRAVASGRPSQPIELQVGSNAITVTVTAQDGVSKQSYIIDVHRQPSSNVSLTGLSLSAGELTPSFDKGITAYNMYVGYGAFNTTVTASVYDPKAQVTLNGKVAANGQASETIPLEVGSNAIEIIVTAPDQKTKLLYTVVIHRASPSSTRGGSSGSSSGAIVPPQEVPKPLEEPKQPVKPPGGSSQRCLTALSTHFADMQGHWAEREVTEASGCGIVSGFEDGTFRPDEPVTRAQFVVMLMQTLEQDNVQQGASAIHFTDAAVIPAWAAQAVSWAEQNGIVNGYEDGTFRSNVQVSRAEMITMAAKAFKLPSASPGAVDSLFSDATDIPAWAKGYAASAQQKGFVKGRENGKFAPNDHTTRAEAITLLLRMLK